MRSKGPRTNFEDRRSVLHRMDNILPTGLVSLPSNRVGDISDRIDYTATESKDFEKERTVKGKWNKEKDTHPAPFLLIFPSSFNKSVPLPFGAHPCAGRSVSPPQAP